MPAPRNGGARREFGVLAALLALVGGIWGFVSIGDEMREGETRAFDERVLRAFRRSDDAARLIGPPGIDCVAHDVTALGSVTVLTLIVVAVCCHLAIEGRRRSMAFILLANLSGLLAIQLLKHAYMRDRPAVVPHLAGVSSFSFPSGHSSLSALVYLTLGALIAESSCRRGTKILSLFLAFLLSFLVGVSRVGLGVHYPTDVLAGWTFGLIWALLSLLVARVLRRRGLLESRSSESCS